MTSWLTYIIIAVIILSVFCGWKSGFLKMIMTMFSWTSVILLACWMNSYVRDFLWKNDSVATYLADKYTIFLENHFEREKSLGVEEQNRWIEDLMLPGSFKSAFKENNNEEVYQILGVSDFNDYVSKYLFYGISNGMSFLLAIFLATLLINFVGRMLNFLIWLPGIGLLNHLGGAIFGVVRGVLWMWIFFILIMVFMYTSFGNACMREVEKDALLNYLYNRNYLMNVIMQYQNFFV